MFIYWSMEQLTFHRARKKGNFPCLLWKGLELNFFWFYDQNRVKQVINFMLYMILKWKHWHGLYGVLVNLYVNIVLSMAKEKGIFLDIIIYIFTTFG